MKPALLAAALLVTVGACWLSSEWLLKRLVMWLIVLLVALNSGCTFALIPTHEPKVKVCLTPVRWRCHPDYEGSDM